MFQVSRLAVGNGLSGRLTIAALSEIVVDVSILCPLC